MSTENKTEDVVVNETKSNSEDALKNAVTEVVSDKSNESAEKLKEMLADSSMPVWQKVLYGLLLALALGVGILFGTDNGPETVEYILNMFKQVLSI